jgi:16S rRNA processing protein RimM
VQEIVEYPYQSLAKVFYGERELLIPLVDEIIVEINDKKKLLLVNMPEGLIDINN